MEDTKDKPTSGEQDIVLDAMKHQTIKFIVCVDGREESHVALRLACIKARKRNGEVDILHVVEPAETQPLFGVSDKMRDERIEEAQAMLADLSTMAESITGKAPRLLLKEGPIGDTIVQTAAETDVNMLVIGVTPGSTRGKLVSWLSTQLGEKLLMPMMLVPGNLTDQQIIEIS